MEPDQVSEFQAARSQALKAYCVAIRMKYSLMADEEIRLSLPAIEAQIDSAIMAGHPLVLNAAVTEQVAVQGP